MPGLSVGLHSPLVACIIERDKHERVMDTYELECLVRSNFASWLPVSVAQIARFVRSLIAH
jgi:hypothetical protein